ncbi:hypothetical protein RAA17_10560 [Komagataeibacter rhaeticus]|nr:hypothetical protein [Komagataeibacter rhaeticus]
MSGLRCEALSARISHLVAGRAVPDDAQIQLRFADDTVGGLWVSQVATGCGNALRLRLFGEKAGLEWNQEQPDTLVLSTMNGCQTHIARAGSAVPTLPSCRAVIPKAIWKPLPGFMPIRRACLVATMRRCCHVWTRG